MARIETVRQIGAAVRNARTQQGLTQQQLADAAGVSRGLINRLEKGAAAALYPEKLLTVLDALNLSLSMEAKAAEASVDAATSTSNSSVIADTCASDALANASSIVTQLAENTEIGTAPQKAATPSIAKEARQFAAILANENLLETSPLFASRGQRIEGGEGR